MDPQQLIDEYLPKQHMMQLATCINGQPWCCTVYFVHDDKRNLYWASLPARRHSREIEQNSKVAVAIPIKHAKGEKVVGIQVEGTAEMLQPSESNRLIIEAYACKFGRDAEWVDDFTAGKNQHQLYKLTPQNFVLFDDVNFPDNPRVTL